MTEITARKALRFLILAQAGITALAFSNEFIAFCNDCAKDRSFLISGTGLLYYALLAFLLWRRPDAPAIRPMVLAAFGTHTILMADLAESGVACWMCTVAAALSLLMAMAALASAPRLAWTMGFFWPLGAAAAAAALPFVTNPPAGPTYEPPPIALNEDSGEIVVFVLYGCGACEKFHQDRTPALLERYVKPGIASFRYVPVIGNTDTPPIRAGLLAAYAAEKQGKDFEVVARLMSGYKEWVNDEAKVYERIADLVDVGRLRTDMELLTDQVEKIRLWAARVRADTRPAVWVHAPGDDVGFIVNPRMSFENFLRSIDMTLQR